MNKLISIFVSVILCFALLAGFAADNAGSDFSETPVDFLGMTREEFNMLQKSPSKL